MSELLDRRINELEHELAQLKRKKMALLQTEMARLQADITGTRPAKENRGWVADLVPQDNGGASEPIRNIISTGRRRMSEDEVLERLRGAVAASGDEGISARQAAMDTGVFYLRAIKVMDEHFVKKGSGKWTRYTLK